MEIKKNEWTTKGKPRSKGLINIRIFWILDFCIFKLKQNLSKNGQAYKYSKTSIIRPSLGLKKNNGLRMGWSHYLVEALNKTRNLVCEICSLYK